ncbi:hypothetical protein E4U60_006122 [Claviceps pazoutovae]|uniref:Aldehyde dehydrogenase domain-containing protein n=1 Tax=Claviceps pazoutovae TaxID=1649127 RepID=A0A9P7MGX1_9HYPO|nr:hypothetical protein E4U60_006122 [Claviceps pazoutovae]
MVLQKPGVKRELLAPIRHRCRSRSSISCTPDVSSVARTSSKRYWVNAKLDIDTATLTFVNPDCIETTTQALFPCHSCAPVSSLKPKSPQQIRTSRFVAAVTASSLGERGCRVVIALRTNTLTPSTRHEKKKDIITASTVVPLVLKGQDYAPKKSFDIKSPVTGKVLHKNTGASVDDAAKAVDAVAEALTSWRRTTPHERQDVLLKAADIMSRRRDELATCMVDEIGCASDWADFNLNNFIAMLEDVGGRVPTLTGSFPAMANPDRSTIVLREPYGVVLSIAAWNAPYMLGTRAIAFPIAAGNTVVLKASESCAGLPKGVVSLLVHEPSDAAAVTSSLITDLRVRKINFTGSATVGRIIAKQATEHLKPVVLELGDLAAQRCALGSFIHGGQICMCTEKILVHKAIKDTFRQKLAAAVAAMFPSDGEAIVLINTAAVHKNKQLVADATERGATILHRDVAAHESSTTRMWPIVVDNVTADMDIYKTEFFGPTVSVLDIESDEEAIRIANDTEYGLASCPIETGAVHINSITVHDESALPHGGAKSSEYGRFNASLGLKEWTRTKNVTFDR